MKEAIEHAIGSGDTLSLERSRGETYANNDPTLYALGTYEKSSVLAGKQRRRPVWTWDSYEQAIAYLAELGAEFDDLYKNGGTTHIPASEMVAHIPPNDYDLES